jgi:hypothetical protein
MRGTAHLAEYVDEAIVLQQSPFALYKSHVEKLDQTSALAT